jgi:agmatinase
MNDLKEVFGQPRNFAGLSAPYSDFEFAKVAILPVPYDGTTEWHGGARSGPRSIIDASFYLEWYDIELQEEIFQVGIHTLPEVEPAYNNPETMIQRVYHATADLMEASKFVVTLGGEHSISLGAIRAHLEKYGNCTVLHLDAHADLRDEYLGTRYSHACVMRRVTDLCPAVQVGIRAISHDEREYVSSKGVRTFFFDPPLPSLPTEEIIRTLTENVYVTIDLDVFDPSIMAAVGTPEPGGLLWDQVLSLLRTVARDRRIIGFDIVELCPDQGPEACSFLAAKLAYKLIGYAFHHESSGKA